MISSPYIDDWFGSIAPVQKSPHEAVVNDLLSRFGVRSALDAVKFMQSPDGKLAQTCLNQAIDRDRGARELAEFLAGLEFRRQQHLAYFILSLEYDDEKARQHMRNIEEEEQTRVLQTHLKPAAIPSITLPAADIILRETLGHYERAREALLTEMSFTASEVDMLEDEFLAIEESINLLDTKRRLQQEFHAQFPLLADDDVIDEDYVHKKIDEAAHAYQQEMLTLQNMGSNADTPSFIEHWNLLDRYQLQASTWHDFRSALAPEQAIVQKNGVLYLINKQTPFDELSLEAREKAAHAYLALKPKLEKTRLRVEEEDQIQQVMLEERRRNLINRIDFQREKISFFQARLSTLDDSIISLSQQLARTQAAESDRAQSELQLRPTPRASFSKISPRTAAPTPRPTSLPRNILDSTIVSRPAQLASQAQLVLKLELCRLRCTQQTQPAPLSSQQISRMAAIERSRLVEDLKTRPKELIPGAQASPSLLSMLIAYNKTTLNIDRRVNNTPEQRLEDAKNDPTAPPRPTPFKKPWEI